MEKEKKEKTTVYLTKKNKQLLRKIFYISGKRYTEVLNEILDENIETYLKKIEDKNEDKSE